MKIIKVELYNRNAYFEGGFAQARLAQYFQFHPNKYQYMPLYKDGKWDGYIKLFSRKYNRVSSGVFLAMKQEMEEVEHIRFLVKDCRDRIKFNDDVDILSDRVYQNLCIRAMQRERSGGLIIAPTASGKTRIAGLYFKSLNGYGCFVVDEHALMNQAQEELSDVLGEKVGTISGIKSPFSRKVLDKKFEPKRVTVSMIQSMDIHKKNHKFVEWSHMVDVVLIDEVHMALNSRNLGVIKAMQPAVVFGLTATIELQKENVRLPAFNLCGPPIFEYYQEEATEEGHIAPAVVCSVQIVQEGFAGRYHSEYKDLISENKTRNRCVVKLARAAHERGKYVVVICERVAHLKHLSFLLSDIPHRTVYGEKKVIDRIKAKRALEKGKIRLIICNKVFKKGIDIKSIDFIIECSALYSKNDAIQKLGRGKRLKVGKDGLIYIDINDRSPAGTTKDDDEWNIFQKASKSRLRAFRKRKIPLVEVKWNGYPEEIIDVAQAKLDRFVKRLKNAKTLTSN